MKIEEAVKLLIGKRISRVEWGWEYGELYLETIEFDDGYTVELSGSCDNAWAQIWDGEERVMIDDPKLNRCTGLTE